MFTHFYKMKRFIYMENENEKMKIALYSSQKEIHIVATRPTPGDLGLKSHPKDIHIRNNKT